MLTSVMHGVENDIFFAYLNPSHLCLSLAHYPEISHVLKQLVKKIQFVRLCINAVEDKLCVTKMKQTKYKW